MQFLRYNNDRVSLSLLGVIVLSATLSDAFGRNYCNKPLYSEVADSRLVTFWHCFSAIRSGKMILSTRTPPFDISCLHGMRFFSTTWIIILHTHSASFRRSSYNMPALNKESQVSLSIVIGIIRFKNILHRYCTSDKCYFTFIYCIN